MTKKRVVAHRQRVAHIEAQHHWNSLLLSVEEDRDEAGVRPLLVQLLADEHGLPADAGAVSWPTVEALHVAGGADDDDEVGAGEFRLHPSRPAFRRRPRVLVHPRVDAVATEARSELANALAMR